MCKPCVSEIREHVADDVTFLRHPVHSFASLIAVAGLVTPALAQDKPAELGGIVHDSPVRTKPSLQAY